MTDPVPSADASVKTRGSGPPPAEPDTGDGVEIIPSVDAPGAVPAWRGVDDETDASLMARLVVGDELALGRLYDRHSPLVYGLARRVTQSDSAAEDIVQDVFAALWEHPERFDTTRGTLRAYLGVHAHRRAVDWVRRETAARARSEREFRRRVDDMVEIVEKAVADDTNRRVQLAVRSLPEDQREAVLLAYFGGHTYREVALILGIPEGTAKSRLRLALAKLAAELRAQGVQP